MLKSPPNPRASTSIITVTGRRSAKTIGFIEASARNPCASTTPIFGPHDCGRARSRQLTEELYQHDTHFGKSMPGHLPAVPEDRGRAITAVGRCVAMPRVEL